MKLIITFLLSMMVFSLTAQENSIIKDINNDIYIPFSNSYADKNVALFASLQSDGLIRVTGDGKKITSKSEYIAGIANWWKTSQNTLDIEFRFLERIVNEKNASERGIYKIIFNKGTTKERFSYGKFHVILEKIEGAWKFIVDYDSSEGNTIGENEFQQAEEMGG